MSSFRRNIATITVCFDQSYGLIKEGLDLPMIYFDASLSGHVDSSARRFRQARTILLSRMGHEVYKYVLRAPLMWRIESRVPREVADGRMN